MKVFLCGISLALCLSVGVASAQDPEPGFTVVAQYPHDPEAFTQGLAFKGQTMFEGTGLEGESSLRRVDFETGEVLKRVDLKGHHFGEGITILGRRIYQLTWRSGKCFVYRVRTFERVRRFEYEGEGWGLTDNRRRLIMSDGSNVLRYRDPSTFEVTKELLVTRAGEPIHGLNELEWVDGEIYANVWPTDTIVRIDPTTGLVLGELHLHELHSQEEQERDTDVTNGIAYMPKPGRLFVTGKWWGHVYEIELTD